MYSCIEQRASSFYRSTLNRSIFALTLVILPLILWFISAEEFTLVLRPKLNEGDVQDINNTVKVLAAKLREFDGGADARIEDDPDAPYRKKALKRIDSVFKGCLLLQACTP